jgi:hypothetical protein
MNDPQGFIIIQHLPFGIPDVGRISLEQLFYVR